MSSELNRREPGDLQRSGRQQALELRFGTARVTSALLLEPEKPEKSKCLYVLAHGAGAGMRHPHLESLAWRLAEDGIATLRYQFDYFEQGRRRPDPPPLLHAAVRGAVELASRLRPDLPLFAGGRSMGGRMTSQAQAKDPLPGVRGLIFLGFPLHPARRPGTERAEHLKQVDVPMLFLNGDRDTLADLSLLEPICSALSERATLHILEGADHSFQVLKRSGRSAVEVEAELSTTARSWILETLND